MTAVEAGGFLSRVRLLHTLCFYFKLIDRIKGFSQRGKKSMHFAKAVKFLRPGEGSRRRKNFNWEKSPQASGEMVSYTWL